MNVLITGAGRGIGRSMALAFGRDGHRVLVNYRADRGKAREVVETLRSCGGEAELFGADVSDPSQARRLVGYVVERWGTIDGLVNNAGITRDRTILKMTEAEWREVLDVNLSGAFWCLQEAAHRMVPRKEGFIINISSLIGLRGSVGSANYAASKAGLITLTKTAAKELGRFNIRVNVVLPGFHPTDMGAAVWEKKADRIREEHTLRRLADLDEVSRFVVFLAKQKSVSGQVFNFESRVI